MLDPTGTGRPTGAQVREWLEPYGLAPGANFVIRLSLLGGGAAVEPDKGTGAPRALPRRWQRSRSNALPSDVVVVTRPTQWGNPYRVEDHGRDKAVAMFRQHLLGNSELLAAVRRDLKGRDLACWCKPGDPCHADVLIELANASAAASAVASGEH